MTRFVVLDSWRGICACMIVLLHFSSSGTLTNLAVVQNGYLFVDFFFVLSGFVIHGNYHHRVKDRSELIKFFIVRFGRLYPLHLFMLLCLVALQSLQLLPFLGSMAASPPFAGEAQSLYAIWTNLWLVQGLGMHSTETWNSVSWSISTELWAYVCFGLVTMRFGTRAILLAAGACLVMPILLALLSPQFLDTTVEYGFVRCLFGFSAGMITFEIYKLFLADWTPDHKQATYLEAGAVATIILYVSLVGQSWASLFAPLLFSAALLIFTKEAGLVSQQLLRPLPALLGLLSYSIYMTHLFVQKFWMIGGIILGRLLNYPLVHDMPRVGREGMTRGFGNNWWQGDVASLAMLASVVLTSYFTYYLIEDPWRRRFRKLASQQKWSRE